MSEYILGANGTSVKIVGMISMILFLAPTLELDMSNIAICLGDFYQGFLGCDLLCGHNEVLSLATITLPRTNQQAAISWPHKKVGCIAIAYIELQGSAVAMMVSSHVSPPPPEPSPLQIVSITFKAEGVLLIPQ